jgi:hypothetical protein
MADRFFDTSAAVKHYHQELGSAPSGRRSEPQTITSSSVSGMIKDRWPDARDAARLRQNSRSPNGTRTGDNTVKGVPIAPEKKTTIFIWRRLAEWPQSVDAVGRTRAPASWAV